MTAQTGLLCCVAVTSGQRRRDRRYAAQLPVRTRVAGRVQELSTEDVSFRGMFLSCETLLPERQLIRIEASLPPGGVAFATHAMVVYSIPRDHPSGRRPGSGIQFYGMGNERTAWEQYVRWVQTQAGELPDRRSMEMPAAAPPAPPASPAPTEDALSRADQRRHPRFPVVLEVRPSNLDDLMRLYSRDVSVGGMFLATARTIEIGSELRLDVRHPHGDSLFSLTAVVRRRSLRPQGIGVEFTGLDDLKRRDFFEFIHAPIPTADPGDLELVESD